MSHMVLKNQLPQRSNGNALLNAVSGTLEVYWSQFMDFTTRKYYSNPNSQDTEHETSGGSDEYNHKRQLHTKNYISKGMFR